MTTKAPSAPVARAPLPREVDAVHNAQMFVDESIRKEWPMPTLAEVAKKVGYSDFHFHRVFKRLSGITLKDFTARAQIAEAKERMLGGQPLKEVATACGFAHQSHFTARFKRVDGQTPARWLRANQAK